jgi:ankyrin repeat protein
MQPVLRAHGDSMHGGSKMARLPERPNFEHLKKQAKDLLRAYEAGDPEAVERFRKSLPGAKDKEPAAIAAMDLKLHDAQSCIAREYGLPTWRSLKNHVDWRNSRASKERKDVVALWLHLVYGHEQDAAQPLLAARALEDDSDLVQDDLFLACAVGDADIVRRALARDPSCVNRTARDWRCPGCKDMLDMPPLVAATHSSLLQLPKYRDGLRRCARMLLDAGADPNQSWKHGEHRLSALYGAAGKNHDPELTQMLLDAGADPNDGESLYHSIASSDSTCTRMLLEAGARVEEANAIAHQLDRDDLEGLRLILQYAKRVKDEDLLWAIRRGRDREHVALLLAAGANPHARTKDGAGAYRYALRCGLADVAEALASAGAAEPLTIEERFVAACAAADEAEARGILAEHPRILERLDDTQLKQLPELAEAGNHAAVRLMVELGWPVAVRGGDWSASALNLAVYQGNAALTRFLLEQGASWSETHGFGGDVCGILSWASRNMNPANDYVACAALLLEYGAPLLDTNDYFSEEVEELLTAQRARRDGG